MGRWDRDMVGWYQDESGERFRELVIGAERLRTTEELRSKANRRLAFREHLKVFGIAFLVMAVIIGAVFAKLYFMGAVTGIK